MAVTSLQVCFPFETRGRRRKIKQEASLQLFTNFHCTRRVAQNRSEMLIRQLTRRLLLPQVDCGNRITVLRALSVEPQPKSDLSEFREVFSKAKHIAIITGAGVSAESGLPTFRAASGHWRKWKTQDLATPQAFSRNSSRVWEFYQYWRELALKAKPSAAHVAIAECEARLRQQGRAVVVITQNTDELHRRAGSKHILEVHGSLFRTRCLSCGDVDVNHHSPICTALEGKGDPDPNCTDADIPVDKLPRCDERGCDGLLRPDVIWFGETMDSHVLTKVEKELDACDLCLLVGTASVVFPAAMFAPQVASRGVPVAEFNIRPRSRMSQFT
ncbi:hypothetical protein AMELA_G00059160 [Ameiurus melas]|uniref:Deacetylase sirtuin-type domain-containing protein n=1 Tax=Ameiurus melas TaxID=219545 RepID=A0A7J6B1Q3_AMEME|nr:hypothetical protein AMELA_G00059160 [Ameiurus melas]